MDMVIGSIKKYWYFTLANCDFQSFLTAAILAISSIFQAHNKSLKTPWKILQILEEMMHLWQVIEEQVEGH